MALRAAKKAAKQWRDGETLVPNAPRYSLGFRSKTVKCRADDALQRTPGMQHCLFFRNHNYGQAHLPGGLLFPRGAAFLSEGLAWYTGINYGGVGIPRSFTKQKWRFFKKRVGEGVVCFLTKSAEYKTV